MSQDTSGLVGNVRGLAADGVRAVRTRMELLEIEFKEEKARITRQLAIAAAALYLLTFGTLLGILWIVMAAPVEQRSLLLGGMALAFLAGGGAALLWLLYGTNRGLPLFATTVAVLKRDEQALTRTQS